MRFFICLSILLLMGDGFFAQNLINPENISIARDKWGTPHVFAKTDPEVAYGLAWANAEDAFERMQEPILVTKRFMGRLRGKKGAAYDFFAHAIGADETYEKLKNTIPEDYLRYVEGYCQGLNAFAKAHPERVLIKKAFPVSTEDIIKSYIVSFSALSGTPNQLENIVNGKTDKTDKPFPVGSNAYAFSGVKTKDGKTYLAINPHFMIEGPLSFYDAHLQSEEGMNITGAFFQGGTCVFMGNNENLGWGHTFNYLDMVDIYELEMMKKNSLSYKIDSEIKKLVKRPVWLKVKIGKIVIPVRKMTYWSVYGPTFKSPEGRMFAIRSPAFTAIRSGEQFYRMCKAKNFEDFKNALRMDALPLFNIVYADKENNIFYLNNGIVPKRAEKFDFSKLLPGNTAETLWTEFYSLEEKIHVVNPECGYVFNTNNTPYNATCNGSNFAKGKPDKYCDLRPGDNNRSTRFMEILNEKDKFDWEEFKAIKFDRKLSKNTKLYTCIEKFQQINPDLYPEISEAIRLFQSWDGDAALSNTKATIVLISLQHIFKKKGYGDQVFISGVNISEAEFIEGMRYADSYLRKHFKSLEVPLGEVNCHERNGKMLCAAGFPDMLSPGYSKPDNSGKMKMEYGDTYIHFVRFTKEGAERIETLLPFENTPGTEQFEDELDMFNKEQLKITTLDKQEILKNAVKTYKPVK